MYNDMSRTPLDMRKFSQSYITNILMYFSASQIEDPYRSPKKLWQFCHFLPENSGDNTNDLDDNSESRDDENYVMLQVFFSRKEQESIF